jgi:hypothetical protein
MNAILTASAITAAQARLRASGATPRTFVCGPARDADWSKLSYHVSAELDGQYAVGSGSTLDAAIDDLLAGTYRRPLIGTQGKLEEVA